MTRFILHRREQDKMWSITQDKLLNLLPTKDFLRVQSLCTVFWTQLGGFF